MLLALVAAASIGCGFQNPFGRDSDEPVAGESTPAEDSIAISNYVAEAQAPDINIRAGGDVFVATDGGSIVYRPVQPSPAEDPEPTPETPVEP
jgi:hypothetical protein